MIEEKQIGNVSAQVEKLEVLSDIYRDLSGRRYPTKEDKDIARLKMNLIKKEMLLLTYLMNKEIESIS